MYGYKPSSFSMSISMFNTLPSWIAHLVSGLGAQLTMDQHNMVASDRPIAGGSVTVNACDGCDQLLKKIFIPDLLARWPFPRLLNQHYSEVDAESSAWLESFKVLSPKAQQAFDGYKCSLLACLCYPNASKEHVRSACDLMIIFGFVDDNSDGLEEVEVRQQKDIIMNALHHPYKPRPKGEWVGGEIVRQFWERTICNASAQSQKRFIATFGEFIEGIVQQAMDRSGHHIRDIQSYFDVRRKTVAAGPSFVFLELGLDIPDEVISHPTIEDMVVASTDMIALANDVTSYNKEQACGDDSHNIVTIVMREFDTDVNGAMLWATEHHTKLEKKYFEARAAIPKWGEPIDSQVREYCDGLGNCVRANGEWAFECERYFGTNGLEVQRKKWMLLTPKDH
ncbi:terpenoid synthase [Suillus subalutaceus]|uniref:terpenoid synthase n=1 Tax=Suillus subalutaceus TaxID=48586 RepID=UPI001B876E6F|nr:terpenoid synthase [Suillus subalutaceus]KAG1876689.1 terpenoid synthase [Suillus subalutaceus]